MVTRSLVFLSFEDDGDSGPLAVLGVSDGEGRCPSSTTAPFDSKRVRACVCEYVDQYTRECVRMSVGECTCVCMSVDEYTYLSTSEWMNVFVCECVSTCVSVRVRLCRSVSIHE